eukprot:6153389-Heterocapsa_arctica.AAC.1
MPQPRLRQGVYEGEAAGSRRSVPSRAPESMNLLPLPPNHQCPQGRRGSEEKRGAGARTAEPTSSP